MATSAESLYTNCIEVLGQDADHISFQRLVENLQQRPVLRWENDHVAYFDFPEHGIELIYQKSRACFRWAVFFVNSPAGKIGFVQRYCSNFLAGVTPDDSRLEVERKIETVPERFLSANESVLKYDLPGQKLSFYFDAAGEQMSHVLAKAKAIGLPNRAN